MQPSVIWIGEAEKMFYKKVPKEEKEVLPGKMDAKHVVLVWQLKQCLCVCDKMDPRRLKKDMLKSLKLIKGEDRVLIMGTSKSPLLADIKSLGKMFNKIILIPRPDYGSRCSKISHCSDTLTNVSMLTWWWWWWWYSMKTDSGFSLVEDAD